MDSKKNTDRFTIKFNCDEPKHQAAVEILNGKGRNKAEYIAKAILEYESHQEQRDFLESIRTTIKESIEGSFHVVISAPEEDQGEKEAAQDEEKRIFEARGGRLAVHPEKNRGDQEKKTNAKSSQTVDDSEDEQSSDNVINITDYGGELIKSLAMFSGEYSEAATF